VRSIPFVPELPAKEVLSQSMSIPPLFRRFLHYKPVKSYEVLNESLSWMSNAMLLALH